MSMDHASGTSAAIEWELGFVLPDLVLRDEAADVGDAWLTTATLDSDHVAIVPSTDHRVAAICATVPAADVLLSGFRGTHGQQVKPAVLICRREFPQLVGRRTEPIIAFRNAVALACVLRARASLASEGSGTGPVWTDVFDLHPTTITIDGRLYTDSPGTKDIGGPGLKFVGVQSPFVTANNLRLLVDTAIYHEVGAAWCARYVDPGQDDAHSRALFRSLEVAYRAASLGRISLASIHDVGVQIALWVSAIEILTWPAKQRANLELTLDLLYRYSWSVPALDNLAYEISVKGKARRVNAVQQGYALLYDARNDFLHGEPVNEDSLRPALAPNARLTLLAAIVYRTALAAYMELDATQIWSGHLDVNRMVADGFAHATYARALASQFGIATAHESDYLPPPSRS